MRILLLHLSDLHIGSEEDLNLQRIQSLTRSLHFLGQVDGVVLVFSGDLAKCGKREEYQLVAAIESGDDIKTVQANLGHATASFTLDVYGHASQRMRQKSADRMEQYIMGVLNN